METSNQLSKIEQLAGQFVVAEIANGQRSYWMHEISHDKINHIAKFAVALAKEVVQEANKPC